MVKVSVILPVYNCVRYFEEAMESIMKQSFRDFEVIIIDDDSHDGTEKIIENYIDEKGVVIIKHQENMGICKSQNDGLKASRGEYIAIQHADDVSLTNRLQSQVQYLDNNPDVALVACWVQYINRKGKKKADDWWLKQCKSLPDYPAVISDKLLKMNCIFHPTVMFRRKIIETVGLYDPGAFPAEDYDYWLRISEKHNIGIINEVLFLYRQHKGQLTHTEKMKFIKTKANEAVFRAKKRRGLS